MILFPYFTVDEPTAKLIEGLGRKMTPVESFEQLVSFVYGQMGDGCTKDQVRDHLAKRRGT